SKRKRYVTIIVTNRHEEVLEKMTHGIKLKRQICLWASILTLFILSYHLIRVIWFGVPLSYLVLGFTGLALLLNTFSYFRK
ncbi:TPA: hypothetical protein ACQM79_001671, partial [Streptococcus pyogenes]